MNSIKGIRIGHAQDMDSITGCTVILAMNGATCGVDQRGCAPCTRDTDKLRPMHLVEKVHGVLLTGGSTFGLSAADGVVRWLEQRKIGFDAGCALIPIVPCAALFDLNIGRSDTRPNAEMGYKACIESRDDLISIQGSIGVGTGATIGHILGHTGCMKGGLGIELMKSDHGLLVCAIIAVNCFGDVINPKTGQILAGARKMPEGVFADTFESLSEMPNSFEEATRNTVIGVVVTNAALSKEESNKVAQMAYNGIGRTIVPASTMLDGDTIFALATGEIKKSNVNAVGALAAEATSRAIINAIQEATSLGGVIALRDITPKF